MKPVPIDANADALIDAIVTRMQPILGERLVGLYLYGSLVSGDYDDGVSDVDLLAATAGDLTDAEFAALDVMHEGLVADFPQWDDRIEIAYLSVVGLQTYKAQRSPIFVISPGEPFNQKTAGRDWLMNWYLVREGGVTLYGAPAQDVIAPVTNAERIQCVREHALAWPTWVKDASHTGFQAYAILTMCRALYTVTTGGHVSKRAAALWAREQLPAWAWLIDRALAWRLASREPIEVDASATADATQRFVEMVVEWVAAQSSPE